MYDDEESRPGGRERERENLPEVIAIFLRDCRRSANQHIRANTKRTQFPPDFRSVSRRVELTRLEPNLVPLQILPKLKFLPLFFLSFFLSLSPRPAAGERGERRRRRRRSRFKVQSPFSGAR